MVAFPHFFEMLFSVSPFNRLLNISCVFVIAYKFVIGPKAVGYSGVAAN